ncbi:hypothetical protein BGX28_001839 [Mortierella sp. GBA30]|nr:hypothetical protein BGX28_001839 [Mortierella sp. GBA30]
MTSPTHEFVQMLMTGHPSPSLDQYLQHELSHHGLKRWEKSARAAYANMQRVAFECLMPACERLLIHLSDILGCSRWVERYGPLRLQEQSVYNCIKLVGDFMGVVERLLLALKVELRQFGEFENWMEQVIEMLQPTLRGADDQGDDGPKIFPPVDVLAVSDYLKSGLSNEGLQEYFQEPNEPSTPGSDLENADSGHKRTHHYSMESLDQSILRRYQAAPSYPIVYSFSEELGTIPFDSGSALDTSTTKEGEQGQKRTNPFAGPAIKAALAGRGFGLLPSKKSAPSAMFSRSGSSNPQPLRDHQNGEVKAAGQQNSSSDEVRQPSLTMEKHLELINTYCQSIFEGPAAAVAKSMKVVNTIDLLAFAETPLGVKELNAMRSKQDDIFKHLKFADRYCYHYGFCVLAGDLALHLQTHPIWT